MRFASIAAAGLCCIAVSAHAEIVHWFDSGAHDPQGSLAKAPDGSLYGTTRLGPTFFQNGSAFKLSPGSVFTGLHQFDAATEGSYPEGLILGADGNFYGLLYSGASFGGPFDEEFAHGAFYRMTPAGAVTVVHAFLPGLGGNPSVEGNGPIGKLVQAADGNFYGATSSGGAADNGTLFRVTPAGDLTTIHTFNSDVDGSNPIGDLVVGPDGALYGVTQDSCCGGNGSVFRITTAGAFSTLHEFADFQTPAGGLALGPDGSLYGLTGGNCCAQLRGTVFKITPAGQFTTLHVFDNSEGDSPGGAPIFGSDGNLYGTTHLGGANNCGTVFMMTPSGVVTTFHAFETAVDGCRPGTGLTLGADGDLYGAVILGGPADRGGLYRVAPPSGALPPRWIQPPTPAAGTLEADVGFAVSIPLKAGDPNAADVVHIAGSGMPAIATLASTDGNPASATFTWTPTSAGVGTRTVTFSATSGADGLSAPSRTFKIHVLNRTMLEAKPALVELSPTTVHLRMKAVLTTPQGPLAGKPLTFHSTKTGVKLCSATTDSAGVAACGALVDYWRIAVNGYTAKFAGDAAYRASTASAGLIGQ